MWPVRIVGITAVKNEIDVIEAFVRHTLVYASRLVVALRAGVDRQVRLRQSCEAEKEHVIREQTAVLLRQEQRLRDYEEELQGRRSDWRLFCAFLYRHSSSDF